MDCSSASQFITTINWDLMELRHWPPTTHGLLFSISIYHHNGLGPNGAAALATNNSWTALQHLNLSHNELGPDGAAALATNNSWTALQHLDLSDNQLGPDGAVGVGDQQLMDCSSASQFTTTINWDLMELRRWRPTTHGLLFSILIYQTINWDLMELRRWRPKTHGLLFSISIYHPINWDLMELRRWRPTTHGLLFSILIYLIMNWDLMELQRSGDQQLMDCSSVSQFIRQ